MSFELEESRLTRRLNLVRWLAGALLHIEAVVALLFPLFLALALIFALSLLGFFDALTPWLHIAVLVALGAATAFWIWRNYRRHHWPEKEAAWRRIEKASGLSHRPLMQLTDRQATNLIDPLARALWRAHQEKLAERIKALHIGWPEFGIAERDPLALRTVVVMLFVVALSAADGTWPKQIWRGFLPNFAGDVTQILADIWISPPPYARVTPIHLDAKTGKAAEAIAIPEKSKILAQVTGTDKKVKLLVNDTSVQMDNLDPASHQVELDITQGEELGVIVGNSKIALWPIRIVKDMAPVIGFAGKPASTDKGALRLPYAGKDDYGIHEAIFRLRLKDKSFDIGLTVPPRDNKEIKGVLYQDLTSHPWAGLEVEAQLIAKDGAGQEGESPLLKLMLPERHFSNPAAKAIIAARKALVKEPDKNREVASALRGLNERPDLFEHDKGVFLGLNTAWRRLLAPDYGEASFPSLIQLMWEIALSIEDGRANDALADLRKLQKELQEALARNAPEEEINRLMNQIQQAMNEYLRQMQQQVEQALRQGKTPRLTKPGLSVTQQDLNRMLEEARRMAQSGSKESAQQLLDQLQQMLENLQAGIPAPNEGEAGEGQQLMKDLAQTMRRQQQLLNQTFQQQQGQSGEQGQEQAEGSGEASAGEQEKLRQTLGGLMRRMAEATGDLPEGMGQAEQQMRDAVQALKEGDLPNAADAQNKALSHLQQSLQSLGRLQRQTLGNRREKMDPLGRLLPPGAQEGDGQNLDTYSTDLPEESPLEQARRIFKELLERRDDLSRPKSERDYLDRLLKQF